MKIYRKALPLILLLCASAFSETTLNLATNPLGARQNRAKVPVDLFGTITMSADPSTPGYDAPMTLTVQFSGTAINQTFLQGVRLLDANNMDVALNGVQITQGECVKAGGCWKKWTFPLNPAPLYAIPPGAAYSFTLSTDDMQLNVGQGSESVDLKAAILSYSYFNPLYGTSGPIRFSPPLFINSVSFLPGT